MSGTKEKKLNLPQSLLLLLLIILALRSIRKEESCSGGCSGCSKGCKSGQALYEAYQQGEKQQV